MISKSRLMKCRRRRSAKAKLLPRERGKNIPLTRVQRKSIPLWRTKKQMEHFALMERLFG